MGLRIIRLGQSVDAAAVDAEVERVSRQNALHALFARRVPPEGMMIIPRRLYFDETRTRILEEGDPDTAFLIRGAGQEMSALEANQLGITKYLEEYEVKTSHVVPSPADEASVTPTSADASPTEGDAVESKAIESDEVENKGMVFPAESRRLPGRPRSTGA